MAFTVEVAGKTDIGNVRSNNEDNFGFDTRFGIYVVCDGMGGQAAGEVASKIAVDTILNYYRSPSEAGHHPQAGQAMEGVSERGNRLADAIHVANQAVNDGAAKQSAHEGMGSTVVAVSYPGEDGLYSLANVGDSRIYLVRNGGIEQLTQDHSLVMEQVRRGLITTDQAKASRMQNIITRALGSEESVEPDVEDQLAQAGDVLVLCSDGLTRHVSDGRIAEIVGRNSSVQQAAEQLICEAKAGGGEDNVTCLLLRFVEKRWYQNLLRKCFGWLLPRGGSPQWQNSI
jgi:protein phosphatase